MRKNLIHTPVGVRDWLPIDCKLKNYIINKILSVFTSYSYNPIETPSFEYAEVFTDVSNRLPSDLYRFFDSDGNTLALRADMTPPIARVAASFLSKSKPPYRLYYSGSIYRSGDTYKGKPGESYQVGIELMEENTSDADSEVLIILINSLLSIGLKNFKIDIGDSDFITGILEESGVHENVMVEIQSMLASKNYIAVESILKEFNIKDTARDVLLNIQLLIGNSEVLDRLSEITDNKRAIKALNRLKEVYGILNELDYGKYISFDLSIAQQPHYYTGIIFRCYTYDIGFSIADGGRYDSLVSKFGRDLPAVGFTIKILDVLDALTRQKIDNEISTNETLLVYTEKTRTLAMKSTADLRKDGLSLENHLLKGGIQEAIVYAKDRNLDGILYFESHEKISAIDIKSGKKSDLSLSDLKGGSES